MFPIIKSIYKILTLLLIILSFMFTACGSNEPELVRQDQFVLGTIGQISGYHTSSTKGNTAITKAYQRIKAIEDLMSTVIEGSDVYRINETAGIKAVEVDDEVLKIVKEGIDFYELTDGAFNIGLGTLIELWDMNIQDDGETRQVAPTPNEIEWAMQHIDLEHLEIDDNNIFLRNPNMLLDLGGIAKGYAVDEAASILREEGVESGFVNLGGDIYVLGPKPDGTPWAMGIQNPEINSNSIMARITLVNKAIVTSGDYQRYFIDNGQHYHHIIDPATGYPAANELSSTTIIANTALEADVLSTAVFIMGLEKGLSFIEGLEDVEGIFVTKDREVYITSGIKDTVELRDPSFTIIN